MKHEDNQKKGFEGLGIEPAILKRIADLGFVTPTPIQYKAIPIATGDEDVVGIAQTGSGKTLAFAIPMIQKIAITKKRGLVLLPTRELAVQVEETFNKVAGEYGLRTALVIGGIGIGPQVTKLKAKPHVIIATPGRLIDHVEQKNVSLSDVGMLVLDEADRMLDMG
ncbi:DEAD/DEAH box helicase, partial [Candidatus Peregrinibacteria bacterium]|nr:DEAD/DEAH box helicase [Candidatus Peregrinibacteria bacterium]